MRNKYHESRQTDSGGVLTPVPGSLFAVAHGPDGLAQPEKVQIVLRKLALVRIFFGTGTTRAALLLEEGAEPTPHGRLKRVTAMPNDLNDYSAPLQRLLRQIIGEKDAAKCEKLGIEISRLLHEGDRIRNSLGDSKQAKGRIKRTGRGIPASKHAQ